MIGTLINIATVLIGSLLGLAIGDRLPEKMRETIVRGLGLVTLVIGLEKALTTANILIPLGSIAVGGILGEWWNIDGALQQVGAWLEKRFNRPNANSSANDAETSPSEDTSQEELASQRFIRGFVTASLVFCVGPLTFLGSIQDGLTGDYTMLAVKSMLDGFAALAFASSLGVGVVFSIITILTVQGSLSLLAVYAERLLTDPMQTEMFATGGIVLLALAISALLEIKPIRAANYLPALILAPLIVAILAALGLSIAPTF